MNVFEMEKEFNDLIKHGQELIEKLKQEKEFNDLIKHGQELIEKLKQEKEPFQEVDENDLGALCKFWNDDPEDYLVGTLCDIEKRVDYPYYIGCCDCWYKHCCRMSPSEVAEITGYKVEE